MTTEEIIESVRTLTRTNAIRVMIEANKRIETGLRDDLLRDIFGCRPKPRTPLEEEYGRIVDLSFTEPDPVKREAYSARVGEILKEWENAQG